MYIEVRVQWTKYKMLKNYKLLLFSQHPYCGEYNVVLALFNTNDDGTLVERWCDANCLVLIHNPNLPKSLNSAR